MYRNIAAMVQRLWDNLSGGGGGVWRVTLDVVEGLCVDHTVTFWGRRNMIEPRIKWDGHCLQLCRCNLHPILYSGRTLGILNYMGNSKL